MDYLIRNLPALFDPYRKIKEFGEYGRISITGNLSNYWQLLAIFLAKMAMNTIRKGSTRCVLVKYSPFIEWTVESKDAVSLSSYINTVENREVGRQQIVELQESQDTEN